MRRRVLMAGGLSGILAALSGCGMLRPTTKERLDASVEETEHVTASDLRTSGEGTMRTRLTGEIRFDVDAGELLAALDPAWKVVVEHVHAMDEGRGEREVQVTAHGADGSTAEPRELLGPEYADQLGPVAFGPFFTHYDLG